MKKINNQLFLGLTAVCGLLAFVMRRVMMDTGIDSKGLLTDGNPLAIGLWVVSIVYLAVLALGLKKLGANGTFRDNFPPCKIRFGLSAIGGALLIAESVQQVLASQLLAGGFGAAAGVCMIAAGSCRLSEKHPSPLFHCVVCVFYIIRLILSFQCWSADPQLQDYALQLLALVCLMLFAFHRASCDANVINRKRTVFFGLAAAYFCLASLSDETMPVLFLSGGAWSVGAGCSLDTLAEPEEVDT